MKNYEEKSLSSIGIGEEDAFPILFENISKSSSKVIIASKNLLVLSSFTNSRNQEDK